MLNLKMPLRDMQDEAPAGNCDNCCCELYGEEAQLDYDGFTLCRSCRRERDE